MKRQRKNMSMKAMINTDLRNTWNNLLWSLCNNNHIRQKLHVRTFCTFAGWNRKIYYLKFPNKKKKALCEPDSPSSAVVISGTWWANRRMKTDFGGLRRQTSLSLFFEAQLLSHHLRYWGWLEPFFKAFCANTCGWLLPDNEIILEAFIEICYESIKSKRFTNII